MPFFLNKSSRPSAAIESEVDLDIRPFMNVLLILIPFLASVAVYTRLSILELSLPPNVGAGMVNTLEKPKVKMTIVIDKNAISITYGEKLLETIPNNGDDYNYALLKEKLLSTRESLEIKNEIIVAVKDPITFKYVVHVMDICKENGFEKIGLAAAAENPEKGQ